MRLLIILTACFTLCVAHNYQYFNRNQNTPRRTQNQNTQKRTFTQYNNAGFNRNQQPQVNRNQQPQINRNQQPQINRNQQPINVMPYNGFNNITSNQPAPFQLPLSYQPRARTSNPPTSFQDAYALVASAPRTASAPNPRVRVLGAPVPMPISQIIFHDSTLANANTTWFRNTIAGTIARRADFKVFIAYPDLRSKICQKQNCNLAGNLAFAGQKPESWIQANNIVAVHSKDAEEYRLKTLRIKHDKYVIDAIVYDVCRDEVCNGCCTKNTKLTGFLIEMEKYTAERFGVKVENGIVEWACLDC